MCTFDNKQIIGTRCFTGVDCCAVYSLSIARDLEGS